MFNYSLIIDAFDPWCINSVVKVLISASSISRRIVRQVVYFRENRQKSDWQLSVRNVYDQTSNTSISQWSGKENTVKEVK